MEPSLRASAQLGPLELKFSLEEAAEKAALLFMGNEPLKVKMEQMETLLRDLSNAWIREGLVG